MSEPQSAAPMIFAAALSTVANTRDALADICRAVANQLAGPADLAFVFVSPHHLEDIARVGPAICDALGTENLLGCSGESIVGGEREIEGQPAISLWAARLPGASIATMRLDFQSTPDGGAFSGWPEHLANQPPGESSLLLLGEPYSFPADALLERLNEDQPGLAVLGGMASGGWNPGQNRVLLGRQTFDRGAVAAMIGGTARVRGVVSQGCRPIGRPQVITKAQRNAIIELSGKPALEQFRDLFAGLTAEEQQLVRGGLHVGRVIDEFREAFGRGDFLVRNVIGADPDSGAIVIGDDARVGQTVQFHVRDAQTADEDLRELLAAAESKTPACGALLFTCNGRGTRLFSQPHHDAAAIASAFAGMPTGGLPVAGFFAQGEIGPVGGKNFLHGFTASIALFERRDA